MCEEGSVWASEGPGEGAVKSERRLCETVSGRKRVVNVGFRSLALALFYLLHSGEGGGMRAWMCGAVCFRVGWC